MFSIDYLAEGARLRAQGITHFHSSLFWVNAPAAVRDPKSLRLTPYALSFFLWTTSLMLGIPDVRIVHQIYGTQH